MPRPRWRRGVLRVKSTTRQIPTMHIGPTSTISIHTSTMKQKLVKHLGKCGNSEATRASIQAVPETINQFCAAMKQLAGRDAFKSMKQVLIRRAMKRLVLHELYKQPHREHIEDLVLKTRVYDESFFDDLRRLAGDDVWNKIKQTKWRFRLRRPVCKVSH